MIQLQSILLPTKEVCEIPELYYHRQNNRIDFNGYFNLFYLEKRKKYTNINNLRLAVCLQGYSQLVLVHDGVDIEKISLDPEVRKEYFVEFPYGQFEKGCFWFALTEAEEVSEKYIGGWFVTEPELGTLRDINIGIDICTYKREAYVFRNLKQLKEKLLERAELTVSSHLKIFIIDNGNSLHCHEEIQGLLKDCAGKVVVIPNKNSGGAGGFTRGMLEILKEKEKYNFTHVLLMDDDAVVEPDALVRIYGMVSMLKEEWKDMTIGGSMLREDYPYLLHAAGEWWDRGDIINLLKNRDLREISVAGALDLTEATCENERYSGWWLCCYSLNVVRKDNLPIPLFLHHDDIEFALRNKEKGVTFLNGICVWHKGPDVNLPGANKYYDVRNDLIEIALHQSKGTIIAVKCVTKALISAIFRLKNKDVELIYKGVCDFLRGPEWLCKQDPEQLNTSVRKMAYQMRELSDLKEQLPKKEYVSVKRQIKQYQKNFSTDRIVEFQTRKMKATALHYLTFNGWILPADHDDIKVIFPLNSPFDTFRKKRVVLCDTTSENVVILERNYFELIKSLILCMKAELKLLGQFNRVAADYCNNIQWLSNQKMWEGYLKIK